MKTKKRTRLLSALLALLMVVSLLPASALAATRESSVWESVALADITASDTVAITMTAGGTAYALPTAGNGGSKQPLAAAAKAEGSKLTIDGSKADYGWTITASGGTYSIKNAKGEALYVTAANNGVRIGTPQSGKDATAAFSVTDGYFTASDGSAKRYLGVYNATDWRCYTSINNNIKDQTLGFWKYTGSSAEEPTVTITPIADAKASASGSFTVKGVVTMIDGRNVYIQDETGGIDLYLTAASDLALGDTVIGTGTRAEFRGLPELTNATYTKDEGLTLSAKETTIGAITAADVCTYVQLADVEVTEVFDNNGAYTNPNITVKDASGATIQIYKAVIGKTDGAWDVKAGDTVTVKAAVGINNTTLQLRNTVASEIAAKADPYADIAKNLNVYERTAELAEGDRVVIYNAGSGQAVTSTILSNYYLTGEAIKADTDRKIISTDAETVEWTVKALSDGTYTFTQGDKVLAGKQVVNGTKTNNNLTVSADDNTAWTLAVCNAENASYYLFNSAMTSKYAAEGGHVYLEWYANFTEFSLYDTSRVSEPAFGMTFYKLVREKAVDTPETPTASPAAGAVEPGTEVTFSTATEGAVISYSTDQGATWIEGTTLAVTEAVTVLVKAVKDGAESETASFSYQIKGEDGETAEGLVTDLSTLKDGDTIVVYNPASGKAMSETDVASYYRAGSDATVTDGKIAGYDSAAVWTMGVQTDASGSTTYTFTSATGRVLTAGTRNSLPMNDANPDWSIVPAATEGCVYIRNAGRDTQYVEWYADRNEFSAYGYAAASEGIYAMQLYRVTKSETPADSDLVTNLDDLDGKTVAIYSPGHKTAISSKPNGDWYLKAQDATVENGKVVNFTEDFVWTAKKNDNGTYSFYAYGDEGRSITVWPSGNYAELSLNVGQYPDNTWTLTPAKTADCFYLSSPTVSGSNGPAYVEAYVRNEFEVYSGYFTSPSNNRFTESEFALQFYLVDPADAVSAVDDGAWDGVLEKGAQYVIYNLDAKSSIGLFDAANFSMKAIPTTVEGDKAKAGNGAYVFTVDSMGRYYTFQTGGKFLATNNEEELFLLEPNADGSAPETAKWFLQQKSDGYLLYNKEASYNGTPVCIEYYSSVFSGWTYSTKNDVNIYLFNFYKLADGTKVYADIVQDPTVKFDGEDVRYIEQDYAVEASLDDLAPEINGVKFTYTVGGKTGEITNVSGNERTYSLTIPAAELDRERGAKSFTVQAQVTNSYGITYTGEKTVQILDEPFFSDLTPRANSQTGENKRPEVRVKIGNVGANPTITMQLNGKDVQATFADGVLTYTPAADLADGRATVDVAVKRADGVTAEKSWTFIVGSSEYQHFFGQLHSHTTYSDGSGTLDAALEYVASLPKSANVQFVAFTDHSNYFDTTSNAIPEQGLYDMSLASEASQKTWQTYKDTVAAFNAKQTELVAIAGFEMTWSGGPGHINTFNTPGIVSRNNATLNNKTNDAGMKAYYALLMQDEGENTLSQFNHPGNTFGNFTDFSYWSPELDSRIFTVEVGNGEGQIGQGGYYPSYEQYTMALDKGWHVAPTNNQDNHKGRWGNANDARDVVLASDLSEESIYEAIRNYRMYATEDKNLDLNYTVNGEIMGTIFSETPEQLNLVVNVFDPDAHESISKVEVVANSGKVAYTWDNATEIATGELTATLEPEYSYYYIRVTQADGDLAVTAPVWVGESISVGIDTVESETEQPVLQKPVKLTTTLFNNEDAAVTVKSLTYTTDGSKVLGADTKGYTIPANGTVPVSFEFTPDVAKRMTITVTAVIQVNGADLTYTKDITLSVRESEGALPVTDIAKVQAQTEKGFEYAIEGVVTSNASGYDKDTAFFDCVYVQDATAGICCFPVSGNYKIGDKVHVEGYTDFYQGEAELQVTAIEVLSENNPVTPTETTAAKVNDGSVLGSLITLKGTLESYELVNGLIQTILVKDQAGDVARVFIDGYITTDKEVENFAEGCTVTVTGLASYDDTFNAPEGPFPRIRIRDRADVVIGHSLTAVAEIPATCEEPGVKAHWKCEVCGKLFSDAEGKTALSEPETIAALGHDWDEGQIAKAPTFTAEGEMTYTCKHDPSHTKTEPIAKQTHCDGGDDCPSIQFTDVDRSADSWYHEPVDWAFVEGITTGKTTSLFAPNDDCTREQVVTFLWRAAGSPEPTTTDCPFTDVKADAYSYQAILWAVENKITNGTAADKFSPADTCTREQIVTFLYRFEKEPAITGAENPFTDVKEGYSYNAILWAAESGVTTGRTATTFAPKDTCTRAEVVTFLYRDLA